MNQTFRIVNLQTEYMNHPLGLNVPRPRFSWKLEGPEGTAQQSCRLRVFRGSEREPLWDSGVLESACSTGIAYAGPPLMPKTRYEVKADVWDSAGGKAAASDWFETGFLDGDVSAWGGARWIGAPDYSLCADTLGVFSLSATLALSPGSRRAGIIFGAGDRRLADANRNIFGLAGNSEIRYVLNMAEEPAALEIFRIGYAPTDTEEPLARVPLQEWGKPDAAPLINDSNRFLPHTLTVEVPGNAAYAYLDGILVDAEEAATFWGGKETRPRQLNPLANNDVIPFPHLCKIGYYAGEGDTARFEGLHVRYLREPGREPVCLEGRTITGTDAGGSRFLQDPSCHSLPMFRRDFTVDPAKTSAFARLYITSRGIYDCRINGQEVTETVLNPGNTQYDKRILYQTYDVTGLLRPGSNAVGVTLGSGWWSDAQTFVVNNYNYYGDRESFLARLEVHYTDGTADAFVSSPEDWSCFEEGPYTYAGLFQGEHLDRRKLDLYERFSLPGFETEGLRQPVEIVPETIGETWTVPQGFGKAWPRLDHSHPLITGSFHAPVSEVCRLRAKERLEPRPGVYLYDLGQEIAGVPQVFLRGEAGTEVTLRYGEIRYPDLPEYAGNTGMILTENYRDAESIDRIILRGDPEGEIYRPRFTFHGFRYIEITGISAAPAPEEVEGIQLSSLPELTGSLETDDPLVNRFIENVRWSQLCNFISVPTDCPQRNERMGWAGDTHVFCRTATYQADTRLFYRRYLEALRDLQEENGSLPDIAPMGGGFGGITYETAMIFIVWELYQQYGDPEIIREFYPAMVKWMNYARSQGMPGEGFGLSLADWLAPEETDHALMFNAFFFRAADLMAGMAKILGMKADADRFSEWAAETRDFWTSHFMDPETGITRGMDGKPCNTQTSYALPVMYGILKDQEARRASDHLDRVTREKGCRIFTGFFGTGLLNPALSAGGHVDTACALIRQTAFPSWLYPVTQGATTIWERWNSFTRENGFGGNNSMNSFNHYSLGSVLSWFYETLLGIRRDESNPGYRHFTLQPHFEGFGRVCGGFDSPLGRIESAWEKKDSCIVYRCTVPANATADLILPDGRQEHLKSGSWQYTLAL
jgi:alpha-L-rhamnosidase